MKRYKHKNCGGEVEKVKSMWVCAICMLIQKDEVEEASHG